MFYSLLLCSILFYCVLFSSIVFYSVWLCSILFYSVLFSSIVFYSLLLCSILFDCVLFCLIVFYSVWLCSILFDCVLFCLIVFYSVWLYFDDSCSRSWTETHRSCSLVQSFTVCTVNLFSDLAPSCADAVTDNTYAWSGKHLLVQTFDRCHILNHQHLKDI